MGLFVEFDVVRNFHYMNKTKRFHIVPDYSEGNQIFVEAFLTIADMLVPVDTGYLSSTIIADCDETSCWAETDCEYAQYPEFGTWCQEAQPYFIPALEEAIWIAKPFWDLAEVDAMTEEIEILQEQAEEAEEEERRGGGGGDEDEDEDDYEDDYEGGGSTSSGSSSLMDYVFEMIAKLFVAILLIIIEVATGQILEPGKEFGSEAQVYIPDVIIM